MRHMFAQVETLYKISQLLRSAKSLQDLYSHTSFLFKMNDPPMSLNLDSHVDTQDLEIPTISSSVHSLSLFPSGLLKKGSPFEIYLDSFIRQHSAKSSVLLDVHKTVP